MLVTDTLIRPHALNLISHQVTLSGGFSCTFLQLILWLNYEIADRSSSNLRKILGLVTKYLPCIHSCLHTPRSLQFGFWQCPRGSLSKRRRLMSRGLKSERYRPCITRLEPVPCEGILPHGAHLKNQSRELTEALRGMIFSQ